MLGRVRALAAQAGKKPEPPFELTGPDLYPLKPDDPDRAVQLQASELMTAAYKDQLRHYTSTAYKGELPRDPAERLALFRALLVRAIAYLTGYSRAGQPTDALLELSLYGVLRALTRRTPFTKDDVLGLLEWAHLNRYHFAHCATDIFVAVVNTVLEADAELDPVMAEGVLHHYECRGDNATAPLRKLAAEVRRRLSPAVTTVPVPIEPGEAWSDVALADLGALPPGDQFSWAKLVLHARDATGSKPSAKWNKQALPLVETVGRERFKESVLRWFPLVDKPRTATLPPAGHYMPDPNLLLHPTNADVLRGLAWAAALIADAPLVRGLGMLAQAAFKKIPLQGARSTKLGNGCVYAFSVVPGDDGLSQLAVIQARSKMPNIQKTLAKALAAVAAQRGIPREDLDELGVPTFGLDESGMRRETLGGFSAEMAVEGNGVELRWFTAEGKALKSVPAAVKTDHAADLKELKQAVADADKLLPALRQRLEAQYLRPKSWPLETWHERYLNHPFVATLARRLIWHFTTGDQQAVGIFHDGKMVDVTDQPLALTESTRVRLWHPIDAPAATVHAWRMWLEAHQVRQPFKQAHREIYILTDAERQTGHYSNRFAAHILKQHQFAALCEARGWRYTLQGAWDSHNTPTLNIPAAELLTEFWVEPISENEQSAASIYLYVSSDQVRFVEPAAAAPRALDTIPPLVFSEVMRDVDLFVGVSSVGNDPTWADRGPADAFHTYWHDFAFGDLGATAQTRRAVLERLLPRLKIADRCKLADRFLIVRGDLRTYKIHLGSANILMEPNDHYLCIVPARGAAAGDTNVYLPFEGDTALAVILSKAFMLAADTKIKDPSIVMQIKSG